MERQGKTREVEKNDVDSICDGTSNAQDHFKPNVLTQKTG